MNEIEFNEVDYLIMLRKKKRITQGMVAKHLQISQAYVSIFETGKYEFNDKLYTRYKTFIENY